MCHLFFTGGSGVVQSLVLRRASSGDGRRVVCEPLFELIVLFEQVV